MRHKNFEFQCFKAPNFAWQNFIFSLFSCYPSIVGLVAAHYKILNVFWEALIVFLIIVFLEHHSRKMSETFVLVVFFWNKKILWFKEFRLTFCLQAYNFLFVVSQVSVSDTCSRKSLEKLKKKWFHSRNAEDILFSLKIWHYCTATKISRYNSHLNAIFKIFLFPGWKCGNNYLESNP